MVSSYEQTAKYEHGFWLQVLGDHARFILDSLASNEKAAIEAAEYFKNTFDRLLEGVETTNLIHLSKRAEEEVKKFREFKLDLIRRHLQGKIDIHLSLTFINHIKEASLEIRLFMNFLMELEELELGTQALGTFAPHMFREECYYLSKLAESAGIEKPDCNPTKPRLKT